MSRRKSQRAAKELALKILPNTASVFELNFAIASLAPLFEQIEVMRSEIDRLQRPPDFAEVTRDPLAPMTRVVKEGEYAE